MSALASAELSATERKRYEQCVREISDGLRGSWKAGEALRDVREGRLYREDFASFEEFCKAVHSITQRYANYLIEAVEIKEDIKERSPEAAKLLTTETQARELANVPRGSQVKVLKAIAKSGETITAATIKAQAESILDQTPDSIGRNAGTIVPARQNMPIPAEAIQLDETDCKIPPNCMQFWNRRQEVQDILTWISRARSAMEKAVGGEKKDPLYWNVLNTVLNDLNSAYASVTNAKPHAVCPDCKGKGCNRCGQIGLICKFAWDRLEPLRRKR